MHKVFIDGAAGTTGLLLRELLTPLERAGQISVIAITDPKDAAQRRSAFAQADVSVLCLPDDAAREAVTMTAGRVLDASSAHRVAEGWAYGFPELSPAQPALIRQAQRVSNPGCFATGAVAILRPLVEAGLIDKNDAVHLTGHAGYTAGGKKTIALYEADGPDICTAASINAPHKHLPEIRKYAGLDKTPLFTPYVLNVPRGMIVSAAFNLTVEDVQKTYETAYAATPRVKISPLDTTDKRLNFSGFPPEDLELHVKGWHKDGEGQTTVFARLDNLGKGAAAQAVQNLRLMLEIDDD